MSIWMQALAGLLVGIIPGFLLFEWLASPFGPGLWKLATPFTRIFLTVSQFIRGKGVLVKRATDEYELGSYIPESEGGPAVQLSDKRLSVDPDNIRWGLFGKKGFGLTWEPGTSLHSRVSDGQATGSTATDGGLDRLKINMAAVHRYLRGSNESEAIDRTEEHAKAEYGGGSTGMSDTVMAVLIIVMLLLGAATGFMAF